jgi:putative membrane protein
MVLGSQLLPAPPFSPKERRCTAAIAGPAALADLLTARRKFDSMVRLLVKWILHALALLITAKLVPGFVIESFGAALIAVLIIGLLNVTLGALLKLITLPLAILTLGLFFLIINALILKLASGVIPGFYVHTWGAALVGALVLAILHVLFSMVMD